MEQLSLACFTVIHTIRKKVDIIAELKVTLRR